MSFESLDGALLVDKAEGLTSAEVLRQLKRVHKIKKLGHSGTLDPMATGLLIVLLGKATRLQDELLKLRKTYSGLIRLGYSTSTDDITGEKELEGDVAVVSESEFSNLLPEILSSFTGKISQVPPRVSAVKVKGQPAYKRARKGEKLELTAREVEVYQLKLSWKSPNTIEYFVECSSGTYVRSIARDIGELLGSNACLESIRRESIGEFSVDSATGSEALSAEDEVLEILPLRSLVSELEMLEMDYSVCSDLERGDQSSLESVELPEGVQTAVILNPGGDVFAIIDRKLQEKPCWRLRAVFANRD